MTQNEQRELKRVFTFLAGFAPKHKLREELQPRLARRQQLAAFLRNPDAVRVVGAAAGGGADDGAALTPALVEPELRRLGEEIAELARRIEAVDARGEAERRIQARDLQQALAYLGKHADKKEVEDMIWEVDENLDGSVDFDEFALMFRRNIDDATGLEPSQLFHVVQFCMYDKDFSGQVSVDEALHMLYARHGKERLEAEMKALFGDSLNTEGNGKLLFLDYLTAVNKRMGRGLGPAAAAAAAAGGAGSSTAAGAAAVRASGPARRR